MKRIVAAVLCAILVSGCASMELKAQSKRMDAALAPFVGTSVASYAASRGLPQETIKLSDNQTAFRWVITGQGAAAVIPVSGMLVATPPQQLTCTIILTAHTVTPSPELRDWLIDRAEWRGDC